MNKILIKNAHIVSEGKSFTGEVLIEGSYIVEVAVSIPCDNSKNTTIIDAKGQLLLPGIIDDQVHFREPGLTHKATIATESKAAVAGGITSYIEMPNTIPQATTQSLLQDKFDIAHKSSYANYSFMFGGTNDNLEELLKTDPQKVAAIKLFLGASTGNMLVDNEETLAKIFGSTKMLIATHCEDEKTIAKNLKAATKIYGDNIPVQMHPVIRSVDACFISSSKAVQLAKKTGARLHVFHLSTEKETRLFRNDIPLREKQITAEVCIHHLWFDDSYYQDKGTLIKWNPAIKSETDKEGLWKALLDDRIDVIATDHAPHTLEEKLRIYTKSPSGGPLVQHSLLAMLEKVKDHKITIEKMVEKMCHNPAILYRINKRGFIKKGYFADLVLVDINADQRVTKASLLYKCNWSPFEGITFNSKITHTFVNGSLVYHNGKINEDKKAMQLTFNR
jgi:dihydroorotase